MNDLAHLTPQMQRNVLLREAEREREEHFVRELEARLANLDPKYAHLPLSTRRGIITRELEREEEERQERAYQERVVQRRAEIAAQREAEASRKAAFETRCQMQASRDTPFVMTSAAGVVFAAIDRCHRFGHNGLVVGAPGVGKTRALEEAVRRAKAMEGLPVGLVTITGVMGNSTMALLEEVAPHLGVRTVYGVAATLKRLCSEPGLSPILLFDEAQNLSLRAARDLLAISEQARVQMLFLGNDEALKFVASQKAAIQQIARRLPIREEIDCILDSDADLIAGQYDVEGPEAFRLCRALAEVRHADGIGKVLPTARALADAAGSRTVKVDHLREALTHFPHFARDLVRTTPASKVERQSSFKRLPTRR